MIGDPRDAWTYRIAVGALGLALLIVLTGAIVLIAVDGSGSKTVSNVTTTLEDAHGSELHTATASTTTTESTTPNVAAGATGPVATTSPTETTSSSGAKNSSATTSPTGTTVANGTTDPAGSTTPSEAIVFSPTGLYVFGSGLAGALLGILIPLPWSLRLFKNDVTQTCTVAWLAAIPVAVVVLVGVLLALALPGGNLKLEILGAACGGALAGLFVQSPTTR